MEDDEQGQQEEEDKEFEAQVLAGVKKWIPTLRTARNRREDIAAVVVSHRRNGCSSARSEEFRLPAENRAKRLPHRPVWPSFRPRAGHTSESRSPSG